MLLEQQCIPSCTHSSQPAHHHLHAPVSALQASGRGAISKLARRKLRKPVSSEAVQRALEQEAESVLAKFAQGGIGWVLILADSAATCVAQPVCTLAWGGCLDVHCIPGLNCRGWMCDSCWGRAMAAMLGLPFTS